MDKYYTPEIEEFHIGFEYRLCDIETAQYINCVFQDGQSVENLLDGDFGQVDIKYLDKEDIESLGWTSIKEYSDEIIFQLVNKFEFWELNLQEEGKVNIEHWYQSEMVNKELAKENWSMNTCFQGTIKNKSELKRLMKQLEING